MPTVLEEMPKVTRPGRNSKYDFDALFSHGDKPVQLVEGEDYDCSTRTMRHNLYRHSKDRNIKIKTVTPEGTTDRIVFRVLSSDDTTDTKPASKAKTSSKKSAAKK